MGEPTKTPTASVLIAEAIDFSLQRNYFFAFDLVLHMAVRGYTVTRLEAELALECAVHIKVVGRRADGRYYYDRAAADLRRSPW